MDECTNESTLPSGEVMCLDNLTQPIGVFPTAPPPTPLPAPTPLITTPLVTVPVDSGPPVLAETGDVDLWLLPLALLLAGIGMTLRMIGRTR